MSLFFVQEECQVRILIDLLLFCESQLDTEATGQIVRLNVLSLKAAYTLLNRLLCHRNVWEAPRLFYFSWATFHITKTCIDSVCSQLYSKWGKSLAKISLLKVFCISKGNTVFPLLEVILSALFKWDDQNCKEQLEYSSRHSFFFSFPYSGKKPLPKWYCPSANGT